MTLNTNIMVTIVAGLALCAFVYNASPETAAVQIPPLLVAIGLLIKQFNTDTKVEKADAKVEKSIAVSEENALSIAASSQQQSHALQVVDQKVDGHLSGLMKDIKVLTDKVTNLEKDKAAARVELTHAVDSEARIVAAIVAAVPLLPVEIVVPPIDEPRIGDKS